MKKTGIVLAAVMSILAGTASAETLGYADAIRILQQTCGADIEKHCRKINLGTGKMLPCIQRSGSATCKVSVVKVFAALEARAQAQAVVAKICDRDIAKRCKGVKSGKARILRCLLKAERTVSKKCNQAIDNAGYR